MQGVGRKARHFAEVERIVHLLVRQDQVAREVLLVVLEDHGELPDVDALRQQIVLQVLQALEVVVEPPCLAVAHEHDAISPLQHQLPGGVVVALPRHGVELELGREAGDRPELQREKVEEQRPVRLGRKRDHPAAPALGNAPIDVLQVRGLAGPTGPVVHELAGDLAGREVDERHSGYRPKSALRLALRSVSKFSASMGAGPCSRGATAASCCTIWSKNSRTMPTDVSGPNTTSPIQRPRGVANDASMQLWRWPPCTSASNRAAPISRPSSSVEATMAAPSAAAVITSSDRLNPCWATTCPDIVMSSVSRAPLSARKVSSGGTTQGSSARIRPAAPPPRSSPAARGRDWRRDRPPRRAPGRRVREPRGCCPPHPEAGRRPGNAGPRSRP